MKLQFEDNEYYLVDEHYDTIASTDSVMLKACEDVKKLSKENCDEIFGVVDMDKICDEYFINEYSWNGKNILPYKDSDLEAIKNDFIHGYNKAMELMGNNKFNDNNIVDAFMAGHLRGMSTDMGEDNTHPICSEYLNSLQQPTEIEVEIKLICPHPSDTYVCGMEYGCDADGCNHPEQIPYLDKTGCLILKRI